MHHLDGVGDQDVAGQGVPQQLGGGALAVSGLAVDQHGALGGYRLADAVDRVLGEDERRERALDPLSRQFDVLDRLAADELEVGGEGDGRGADVGVDAQGRGRPLQPGVRQRVVQGGGREADAARDLDQALAAEEGEHVGGDVEGEGESLAEFAAGDVACEVQGAQREVGHEAEFEAQFGQGGRRRRGLQFLYHHLAPPSLMRGFLYDSLRARRAARRSPPLRRLPRHTEGRLPPGPRYRVSAFRLSAMLTAFRRRALPNCAGHRPVIAGRGGR